jgi:hypothetical protein
MKEIDPLDESLPGVDAFLADELFDQFLKNHPPTRALSIDDILKAAERITQNVDRPSESVFCSCGSCTRLYARIHELRASGDAV